MIMQHAATDSVHNRRSLQANLSALLSLYNTYKDVPDASNEALRCIANAMLLIDQARVTFIDKQVGGGEFAVELLEVRVSAIHSSSRQRLLLHVF